MMTQAEREREVTSLIRRLHRALSLTKCDAERGGSTYGTQATCVTALRASGKWLRDRDIEP